MAQAVYYLFLLIQFSVGDEIGGGISDEFHNIQYSKQKPSLTKQYSQPNFQQLPLEQRIYDRPLGLLSSRSEFMGEPSIPDPLFMPYPSRDRKPFSGPRVRFEPPSLDFSDVPLGQEIKRTVKIYNLDENETLQIKSISSPNSYFSSTFPSPNVIRSNENGSFDVIFIPRTLGNVEQTLYIESSFGHKIRYSLFGVGVESPYRIRPFLGARIPMNASYSPKISIYNPESVMMQITEMYSSSPRLQITLGNMYNNDIDTLPTDSLQVGPFEEKEVGFASYLGRVSGLQNAFIRIKLQPDCNNLTPPEEKKLIIPLEVEVSDVPGIYASTALLDFGIVRQTDGKKELDLSITNSGKSAKEVVINWIRQTPFKEPALKIDYKSDRTVLKPNSDKYEKVASLTFDYETALQSGSTDFSGFIRVHVKNPGHVEQYDNLDIPWKAKILDGNLEIEPSETQFLISQLKEENSFSREVTVTNTLSVPLVLYRIELGASAQGFFATPEIEQPIFIQPLQKSALFELSFTRCRQPTRQANVANDVVKCLDGLNDNVESIVTLHTNASSFSYPLRFISGMIKHQVVAFDKYSNFDSQTLDFGLTSVDEQKCVIVALHNRNKREVLLSSYSIEPEVPTAHFDVWPLSSLIFGVGAAADGPAHASHPAIEHKRRGEGGFPLKLPENTTTYLEVCCHVSAAIAELDSLLNVVADFQTIRIPIKGRFSDGKLKVIDPPVLFPPSFPGKRVNADVIVYSTFKETFEISRVVPEEPKYIKWHKIPGKEVRPMTRTKVGYLEFDASGHCSECKGCIGSLTRDTPCGRDWHEKLEKPHLAAKMDSDLYRLFRERFDEPIKTSAVLYTKLMTSYDFEFRTNVQWPRLHGPDIGTRHAFGNNFVTEPIQFPQTVVGARPPMTGQRTLKIENPTDFWVLVQPILLGDMEQKHKIETALKDDYPLLGRDRKKYSDDFGIGMNKGVHVTSSSNSRLTHPQLLLPPKGEDRLHLGFLPKDDGDHEAILLLRNNLTVVEPVRLIGRGVKERLTLLGENDIFIMSMRDEDLKECGDVGGGRAGHSFFAKGSTTKIKIQNYSSIASRIKSIKINNETCAGGGWEVTECQKGALPPNFMVPSGENDNGMKDIRLRYRPDFSMLETNARMTVETANGEHFHFTLIAKIPEKHISTCRAAIPRPTWEPACRRIILIMMLVLLLGILLMGFIEASYIVEPWIVEVKSRPISVSNLPALIKLYPEQPVRRAREKSASPLVKSSSNPKLKIAPKIVPKLPPKTVQTVKFEEEEEEDAPMWVDEPVKEPDFDQMAKLAAEFHESMAKERGKVSGRQSPGGSVSSMQSSTCFPNSDTSDMNKTGDQSSSSLSSKAADSDEADSDHQLLDRHELIRKALFPSDQIFNRDNGTPESAHRETPNSSSSDNLTHNFDKNDFGLRSLPTIIQSEPHRHQNTFDPAPGARPYRPAPYIQPPPYPYHERSEYAHYMNRPYPNRYGDSYGGVWQQPHQLHQYGRYVPAAPEPYDPVLVRARTHITPPPPPTSSAPFPPPGFESNTRGGATERQSMRDNHENGRMREMADQFDNFSGHNDFQFMSEEHRRKLREDVAKEGRRFAFKDIWKN